MLLHQISAYIIHIYTYIIHIYYIIHTKAINLKYLKTLKHETVTDTA